MVKEKAYAKINLFLDILGKREDNFHNLETVMVPLDLHDTLTFEKTDNKGITLSADQEITRKVEDNLVYKIALYMLENYPISQGVAIQITKRIPVAAGLAGGSADAAATLRGLNRLFKIKLSLEDLEKIGEIFGADIPYCVHNKLCIARGKGEQLFFVKGKIKAPVMLVVPNLQVLTKEVYESVDMAKVPIKKITAMSNAIYNKDCELIVHELYNALEPFTFKLYPKVKQVKSELLKLNIDGVLMSGSGPTIFGLHKNKKELEEVASKLSEKHQVVLTKIKS